MRSRDRPPALARPRDLWRSGSILVKHHRGRCSPPRRLTRSRAHATRTWLFSPSATAVSLMDGLYVAERDEMADDLMYRSHLPHSTRMQAKYSLRDDRSPDFLDMMHAGDMYKRRSDYGSHSLSQREGRRSGVHDGDQYKKIPYSHLRSDDRGRDSKRSRLEHRSHSRDRHSREHRSHSSERPWSYRTRSPDRTQNLTRNQNANNSRSREHSPYSKNDEFRELEIACRRKEQEERIRAEMFPPSQHELSRSSYGLSEHFEKSALSMQHSPRSGYVFHRPDEAPQMPKKSILKKRIEPGLEPSTAMQFDEYCGIPVTEKREHQDCYSPLESFMRLPQHVPTFPEAERYSFMGDNREMHQDSETGGLPGLTNAYFHFAKYGTNSELDIPSENKDCVTDFLLPHEQASQENHEFSRILGLLAEVDNNNLQERKHNFPDIEEEERFLYGEDEEEKTESSKFRSPSSRNLPVRQTSLPERLSSVTNMKPDKEYEKIHDLLKTIWLDIGVSEISKLAARTQERLHGKKTSTRSSDGPLKSHHSGSLDKRKNRKDVKSPEPQSQMNLSKQENISCPGLKETKQSFRKKMTVKAKEPKRAVPRYSAPTVPVTCKPGLLPTPPPAYVMPPCGQYPIPAINYLPNPRIPNFNHYDPYLTYSTPAWPTCPPPQDSKPSSPMVVVMHQPNVSRPNLRVIETVKAPINNEDQKREESVLVQVQTTPTPTNIPVSCSNRMTISKSTEEEKRKAEQKRKVLKDKAELQKEKESRQKRLDILGNELQKIRKQQGELLRKKRREKDGHKDPLLVENGKLQEDIVRQMSIVRQKVEDTDKKISELEKVAQILGVEIQEKTSKKDDILEKVLLEGVKLPSSKEISTKTRSLKELYDKTEKLHESISEAGDVYEYYDAGNHWCKSCNTICGTLFDFFTHMHNKRHRQTLDPYDRPWSTKMLNEDKNDSIKRTDKVTMPAKGSEFLIPITGFYCQLCEKFYGDQICAEDHVKSHGHNDKYKEYLNENPVYEQRRNLDRQAGLVVIMETERRRQAGLKRKMDEEKEVQKQKLEEIDESKAKLIKLDMEEHENVTELEEEKSDHSSSRMIEPSSKPGIKLMLKMDEIEDKKDEEQGLSFGKFSWKKPEKEEEKSSLLGTKEEQAEGSKEKDDGKGQGAKSATKTIEIKLSGKTLISRTSPWVPFTSVTTTTQAKIRPNLPVANVPQRKGSITSVNKPAPLDTFLSIRSSGASNKPLPVVKVGRLLAPEVISKAFGGEEVTLKGSVLDVQREADPLAEEPAPGVSECEQTVLAITVRPPPPPPPTSLSDSTKKIEKPKSCLAAANAKDLYGIYYSRSRKSPADSRLGGSAHNPKLVHGSLKPLPNQVKMGEASSSTELGLTKNAAMDIPKATDPDQKNEMETDEQAESRYPPDVQDLPQCEDDILSDTAAEKLNQGEVIVAQHDSRAEKKAMGTVEQGENNLAGNVEELDSSVLQTMVEQLQQYEDETKEAENVELHGPILEGNAEQCIIPETVKDMHIAEEDQQCDDGLGTSNAFETKNIELVASPLGGTADDPQAGETESCNLTVGEAEDVDAPVIVAGSLSDAQRVSSLADQVSSVLESSPKQCDRNLNVPIPTKQGRNLEMDSQISDSSTDYLKESDIILSFPEPVDKVKVVKMSASELDKPVDHTGKCSIGPSLSQPTNEVEDVNINASVLGSTGSQVQQCESDISYSESIDQDKDVEVDPPTNNYKDQGSKSDAVPSFCEPSDDTKVDVPVLDSTADHLDQCDTGISFSDPVDEADIPVLDTTADQLKPCDTGRCFSDAVDKAKSIEVDAFVSDGAAEFPRHCDTGISFPDEVEEAEDIKVAACILGDNAEAQCDAGFSILNPIDKLGHLKANAPKLHSTVEQQQHYDKVEEVRDEEIDGERERLIGISEMCSSLQTDLCPLLDQQGLEMTKSLYVKPWISTEEQRSSLQAEQVGNVNPEPEHQNGSGIIGIPDPTKCWEESEVSTLSPEAQRSDNGADPSGHNIHVSTLERTEKETSMPVITQSGKAGSSGHVGTQEDCKISGSSRTSSRRAAQAGKAAVCVQTPDNAAESSESGNIQEPSKQLRRRSARNLRSAK